MTFTGVAIGGRAGSGKSTIARMVASILPLEVDSLAAAIKSDLATLGVEKGQGFARECMIAYGQNRRSVEPDHWLRRLEQRRPNFAGIVVDDMRFLNEAHAFRGYGLLIARVDATVETRAQRLSLDAADPFLVTDEASEASLDDYPFDLRFDNESAGSAEWIARRIASMYAAAA